MTESPASVAATNRRVWQSALPALRELNRRDLPFIILKSLPQIEELYGGPGGRLTLDVDILVAASQIEEAFDACRAAGYEAKIGGHYPDLAAAVSRFGRRAALRERKWTLVPQHAGESFDIDLHNDGIDPWRSPALRADVWESAREQKRDGVHFLTLSPEDRLIYLCWTIADEGFHRRKTRDIAQILRDVGGLDWQTIESRARKRGLALTVQLVCDLTARWWDVAPPYQWHYPLPPISALQRHALFQLCMQRPSGFASKGTYAAKIAACDRPLPAWLPALRQWAGRRIRRGSTRRDHVSR
jgi:hypothetical protein